MVFDGDDGVSSIESGMLSPSKGRRHIYRQLDDDYERTVTVLGEGVTGEVVKARRKSHTLVDASLPSYAVKTIQLVGAEAIKLERTRREVDVLMCIDHPHIARIDDVYETGEATHLVMECCEGGDVCDRFNEFGRFSEGDAASTIRQMLLAIQYLHYQGIAHRDIKMDHFMYISKESSILKLIDFGLCQRWTSDMPSMTDPVGTLGWVAPEVLGKNYTNKCDMWSLGCIAFNLLLGFRPFLNEVTKDNFQAIRKGAYREKDGMWDLISEEASDFILKLLEVDPDKRPTAQQALKHPWMMRWQSKLTLVSPENIIAPLLRFSRESCMTKFCYRALARTVPRGKDAELRDTFISMDREKKGTLSLDDILHYAITSDAKQPELDISMCLKALKTDSRHEMHYSEFVAAMLSPQFSADDPLYKDALMRYCRTLVGEDVPMLMSLSSTTTSSSQKGSTLGTTAPLKNKEAQHWKKMKKMLECWSHKRRRSP